jgi:hypothetical protein
MPDIFVKKDKKEPDKESAESEARAEHMKPEQPQQAQAAAEHKADDPDHGKMGFFTALCEYPRDNIKFVNQGSEEEIVLFLRQHFATNLSWIIPSFIAIFIPPLIWLLFAVLTIDFIAVPAGILTVIILFYYLILIGYIFTSFLYWFFNIGIVTQKRMVDIDYSNILHKNIASVQLSEVVDTEFTQKGLFQSIFNYGDILIQTEGIKPNFDFRASPKPAHATDIIHGVLVKNRNGRK